MLAVTKKEKYQFPRITLYQPFTLRNKVPLILFVYIGCQGQPYLQIKQSELPKPHIIIYINFLSLTKQKILCMRKFSHIYMAEIIFVTEKLTRNSNYKKVFGKQ